MSTNNPSNPAGTNMQPAEKQKNGMRLSIRTKITLWTGLCLAVVSLILIGYSVITLRQTTIDNSTREATAIAETNAVSVKKQLDEPLLTARTLAQALGAIKDPSISITMSRDEVNAMLRRTLIENPSFFGTDVLWEPNAFDGLDAEYVGAVAHDNTGRFIPYWVRDGNGIIHTEALTGYETPGIGDWYILPRQTKKETTFAPLIYNVQGQDVVMASFVVPIVTNDKFYGIVGVDARIDFVQKLVDSINLYEGSASAVMFTDTGTLIAVRQKPELTNQPANLIYEDFDKIKSQLGTSFTRLSPDGKSLQIFSPIDVGGENTHWVMGLIIPFEKITAPATAAAIRQVAIGTGLIVLALIVLWLVAGQVVRPLQILTNAATAVSQGDWTVKADIHSNDESEVLANAFNSMTSQLQTVFGTLELRVADRTKALETVAEISTVTSTILESDKLLQEVVDLSKERFNLYHSHIYLLDEAGENLVLAAGAGEPGKQMVAEGRSIPLNREQSLVARAAREQKGVTVNDVTLERDFLPNPLLPETRSELAVPMIVGEKVIGVFDVQSDVIGRFTDADIAVQATLASQVASAVQNARLYTSAEQALRVAKDLVDYATEGLAILDLETELWAEPNENFANTFGMSREELAKTGPKQMSPPKQPDGRDSVEKAIEMINIAMKKGSHSFEWVHTTAQGNNFTCEIRLVRMPGARPRLRQSITDITERRRTEELIKRQAQQQEALNRITQKIQSTTNIGAALQIAARELGHALGMKSTLVTLEPETPRVTDSHNLPNENEPLGTGVSQ